MKTAIVTDSTAYLNPETQKKYNIRVIPIPVIFGEKSFREGIDISSSAFYSKMKEENDLPKTSQPPIGALMEEYEALAKQGYDNVISIHLASTISGMYNAVCRVAKMVSDINVIPFNSELTVDPMAQLAIYASKLASQGIEPNGIITKLKSFRETIDELIVVDDLTNLVKGGRLSNASGFVAGMLNIKPILTFDDDSDEIVAFDKVRTKKKALKRVEDIFAKRIEKVDYPVAACVIDANNPTEGDVWKQKIEERFPQIPVHRSIFGPVIGTHLGSGALALAWYEDLNKI